MTNDRPLILDRLTDTLRQSIGAGTAGDLANKLTDIALGAVRDAGGLGLTRSTLRQAQDLIDALEEAILTGRHVDAGAWRVEVDTVGAPAHDLDRPEDRPLVDDVVVYHRTAILSEVLL